MYFLNHNYKFKLFFLSLLFSCLSGRSALLPDSLLKISPIIKSFEPDKIINTSPNYSMVFDGSGILFLGQQDKINIFDGFSWTQIHLEGHILLARNSLNTIYFSGENSLGYLAPDSLQKIDIHYLNSLLPEKLKQNLSVTEIECAGKTVFFRTDSILFSYDSNTFTILDSAFQDGKIFKCGKNLITLKPGNHISFFENNIREKTFVFQKSTVKFIFEHEPGYLIVTTDNKYFLTNDSFRIINEWNPPVSPVLKNGISLNTGEYFFAGTENSFSLCEKNGKIKSRFNTLFNFPQSEIAGIEQDSSGNIWILQEKSITRIEYPSSFGIISDIPSDFGNILDLKAYDNKIYVAASGGLYYRRLTGDKYFSTSLTDFCYRLIPTGQGLFAITPGKIYCISGECCYLIYTGKSMDQSWNPGSNKLYISEENKIIILSLEKNKVITSDSIYPPVNPIKILSADSFLWITDGESIYFYKSTGTPHLSPAKLNVPSSEVVELFYWQNKLHILSDNKIYSFTDSVAKYENSLSNDICSDEFLRVTEDQDANIYLLTRNHDKNTVLWFGDILDKTLTRITFPPFISVSNSSLDNIGNKKFILSAGGQIFLLDLNSYTSQTRKFETIVKKITAGTEILFQGVSYNFFRVPLQNTLNNIPFYRHNIRIELSSTNYTYNKVKYQYLLNGINKNWSEWNSNSYIFLQDLKEGSYELKIRCKDCLNETSVQIVLFFRILPPFYRTWWAYLIYAFTCGILLFIAYKTYLLNLHKTRGKRGAFNDAIPDPDPNPIELNSKEPGTSVKKFDFFSNIDEDKVKDKTPWEKYEMVTVLFSDIQGFTKIAESMNPELLIDELDRFFYHFDSVVEKYNIEKIKTIGDAYMAAGGIPKKSNINPIEVVLAALEMQNYMKQLKNNKIDIWDLRIGIHSGPVIAGIIGHKKRSFDIWGDTVNTASRMETTGEPGKVNISSETYKFVKDYFICEYRGKLPVKYKGNIDMYFVKGLRPELSINLGGLPNRKFYLKLQILHLADLEEIVFFKLDEELNENMFFHNSEYARHLYDNSELLCKATDLDMEETLLIRTSSLLLNVGFTGGYENQENRSAEYARSILPQYNYSEKQISVISNLILSSKWPPEPRNQLEMILSDIKMEFIGRADYIRLYKLLFREQNQFTKSIDILEFKRNQTMVIQQYPFFTEAARRLREVSLTEQISRIKEDDWK
jgi:adenylate cyclase